MTELITTFFFLFAVVDPIGTVPVYLEATKDLSERSKKRVAVRSSLIAFAILLFFIVVGQVILEGMEVTLDAFQISGGVILFLFALTMIFGDGKVESERKKITDYKHVTVFPVAIPAIASPGAIMAVVILTDNNLHSIQQQAVIVGFVLLVVALTAGILLLANRVQKFIGDYGITVISKIMGLILAAYAVQSIMTGAKSFFLS